MKKLIITALGLLLLILSALAYIYLSALPKMATHKAEEALVSIGFKSALLPEPRIKIGVIRFENIQLDPEPFGTIKTLDIRYHPFGLLWNGDIESISIDGAELIGEMEGSNLRSLSFPDWDMPHSLRKISELPIKNISLKNARISILSSNFGGVSFLYDLEARQKEEGFDFQAHIKTAQNLFSFEAQANGVLHPEYWSAEIDLEKGKINIHKAFIKASRVNGWINMTSTDAQDIKIMSELRAGGASIAGLPWKSASATLEWSQGNLAIFSEGKSIGHEGLELGLNYEKTHGAPALISGTIHMDTLRTALNYLESHKKLPFTRDRLGVFENVENISLAFKTFQNNKRPKIISYTISDPAYALNITGKIKASSIENYLGDIKATALPLGKIPDIFPPISEYKNPALHSGTLDILGRFSKKKAMALKTNVKIKLNNSQTPDIFIPLDQIK